MQPSRQNYITVEQTEIQLVEPHNHRVNAAEPAVKSTKYYTLANFATLDPNFPIQLWCKFTKQIETTLNILRTSRRDNSKSAYHNFHNKKFDWNKTPLASLGIEILTFKDPDNRRAWQPHGVVHGTLALRWSTAASCNSTNHARAAKYPQEHSAYILPTTGRPPSPRVIGLSLRRRTLWTY